jgi:hypothetical protein
LAKPVSRPQRPRLRNGDEADKPFLDNGMGNINNSAGWVKPGATYPLKPEKVKI